MAKIMNNTRVRWSIAAAILLMASAADAMSYGRLAKRQTEMQVTKIQGQLLSHDLLPEFIYYKFLKRCADRSHSFTDDDAAKFFDFLKSAISGSGSYSEETKNKSWSAAEAGLESQGIDNMSDEELSGECAGLRRQLTITYPFVFKAEQTQSPF